MISSRKADLPRIRSDVTDFARTVLEVRTASPSNLTRLTCDIGPVCLQRDQDIGRLDLVLVRQFLHHGVLQQGRVVGSEGGICGQYYAVLIAMVHDILLNAGPISGVSLHT